MKRQLLSLAAAVAALGAGVASAQIFSSQPDYRYGGNDAYGQNVRCESRDSRTEYCRINAAGEVRVSRQLSDTRCIQGRNWDYTRDAIRVSGGCRADFVVMNRDDDRYGNDNRYGDGRPGNGYGRDQVVRCDVRYQGRNYCGDASSQYTMIGYRNGNCIQGRNFGQDSRGLWVSGNCSAQFRRVNDRNDHNDGGYGNGYGNQGNYAQTIRCISNSSGRSYCGDNNARYALRDTGNRYCVEGRTYGTDSRGLWVSNPCQAEFTRYPLQGDRYQNGSYRDQPYYESERQRD